MNKKYLSFTSSTQLLIKEALSRGIKVDPIYPRRLLKLIYKNHIEYIFNQQISKTSGVGLKICDNKSITKELVKKAGLKVAKGILLEIEKFNESEKEIKKLTFPVIIKPLSESHGTSVITNINDIQELKLILKRFKNKYKEILIEEQFVGEDYRFFTTKNKVLGVIKRIPANVTGDGKHTVRQLINIKNKDSRRGEKRSYKALMKIETDDIVLDYLKKQKMTLNTILKNDQIIYLRKNANISTGGDSIDCTDIAHKSIKDIAVKAIRSIPGLCYGGVDIMTKDITKLPGSDNYILLEINASPGFDIHTYPYQGKGRDIAGEIVNIAFPETRSK